MFLGFVKVMDLYFLNLGAVAVELSSEELMEIDIASSKIIVQGDRYSGGSAKLINR